MEEKGSSEALPTTEQQRLTILIIVQRDTTQSSLFIILRVHSTCFGCQPHPSSGVHKNCNYSLWYWSNLQKKK